MRGKKILLLLPLVALLFILVGSQAAGQPLQQPGFSVSAWCYMDFSGGKSLTVTFWWTHNGDRVGPKHTLSCDENGPNASEGNTYDTFVGDFPSTANDFTFKAVLDTGTALYKCVYKGRFPQGVPAFNADAYCRGSSLGFYGYFQVVPI